MEAPTDFGSAEMRQGAFSGSIRVGPTLQSPFSRSLLGELKELLSAAEPVLVVEAATGILAGALRRCGLEVFATDASSANVIHLRRSLPEVPAAVSDFTKLPFASRGFGSAVVTEGANLSAELGRLVRPGGILVVVMAPDHDDSTPTETDLLTRVASLEEFSLEESVEGNLSGLVVWRRC